LGTSLDERRGTLFWKPLADSADDQEFVVAAVDGRGASTEQRFVVRPRILPVPLPEM